MKHEQPAQKSYFFHGGFIDLGKVVAGAFKHCGKIIAKSAAGIAESWDGIKDKFSYDGFWMGMLFIPVFLCKFAFYFVRLISSAIVTPLICFSITMLQVSILLALFSIALILFGLIILVDRIYCTINAIVSHCPNCQHKFSLPVYTCSCGREHTRLRPGIYGIFKRKCDCGKKIPTTFFNGRQKLAAKCPDCGFNIKGGGLHASWCIPVIGGPSSGKTCYINMTMMSLEKNAHSRYGLRFEHEENGLDEYTDNATRLLAGRLPEKTTDLQLRYYQFTLTPNKATKQQISLCDVAGELFNVAARNEMNRQKGFKYANAFMLIIDPLSIPEYRKKVSNVPTVNINGYRGSDQPIDEMVDTFINTLQNIFSIKASDLLNSDVAVIFSKADIPGLDEKIGERAVLANAPSRESKAIYETQNRLCEDFLSEHSEENFLRNLKSRFKTIQFFTCSALGHVENTKPFVATNVEEPFFWLLSKKSKVIAKAVKKEDTSLISSIISRVKGVIDKVLKRGG